MRVRLSAIGLGFIPFASSLERMNWSIGDFPQLESRTVGGCGLATGCQAQCFLLGSTQAFCSAVAVRGSGAPIFTQTVRSLTWASVSFLSLGGICRSGSV